MAKLKSYTIENIRQSWIGFFKQKDHLELPSASLIPTADPTLLFTTAGMVPFKDYFSGSQTPPSKRVVTIQKCIRTTDLEQVGKTDRHCTFFEMLGNFSFDDYFKKEAIELSWEFSLDVLGLSAEKIFITVYEEDDESFQIWNKEIGIPENRITRLGKADNWWGPAGDSGACGPCSELYLDRGSNYCSCKESKKCHPGNDCDRFMEYWNLVFNEYNQDTGGKLHPLPKTGIDTGAGLERLAALLNGLDSVYETDEMIQIIQELESLTSNLRADKKKIQYDPKNNPAPFRVITDHVRSSVFAIADGVFPDNTGRGYVVRRLIRRALLFARELGINEPVMCNLVPIVIEIYHKRYPELKKNQDDIIDRIRIEEKRFLHTLEQGLSHWSDFCEVHKKNNSETFSGRDAFVLYDTFGFPLEMTRELAVKEGWDIDQKEFDDCMTQQQKRSSVASSWKDTQLPQNLPLDLDNATTFLGYKQTWCNSKVLLILDSDKNIQHTLKDGEEGIIVLDSTVCYAEGGGQQGDTGLITMQNSIFEIQDTQKKENWYLHFGKMRNGILQTNDSVNTNYNKENRQRLERHHSATHLLNQALRNQLGDHIKQTGSLVSSEYLRFDFSHSQSITPDQLERIETQIHLVIDKKSNITIEILPLEEASSRGAVATFGEKYSDTVRMVGIGEAGEDSLELCGGCHVKNTDEIGFFHITKESSPGAGNRRIEALAGDCVLEYFQNQLDQLNALAAEHNAEVQTFSKSHPESSQKLMLQLGLPQKNSKELINKPSDVLSLKQQIDKARGRLQSAQKKLIKFTKKEIKNKSGQLIKNVDLYIKDAKIVSGLKIIEIKFQNEALESIRDLSDKIKEKLRGVVILMSLETPKPVLLFTADKKAILTGIDCSDLIKKVAPIFAGSGGGKPDMAQAGGKDSKKLDAALEKAMNILLKNE